MVARSTGPRLVHVDDLKDTLDSFARLFRRRGWEVTKCHDLAEAMAALASGPAQLLLVDLSLQDADGLEVVTAARTLYPNLEIVVLTCSDPEGVSEACRAAGANRVLHKIDKVWDILTPRPPSEPGTIEPAPPLVLPLRTVMDRHIMRALELYRGNRSQAARALEISLNTLKRHLAELHKE